MKSTSGGSPGGVVGFDSSSKSCDLGYLMENLWQISNFRIGLAFLEFRGEVAFIGDEVFELFKIAEKFIGEFGGDEEFPRIFSGCGWSYIFFSDRFCQLEVDCLLGSRKWLLKVNYLMEY